MNYLSDKQVADRYSIARQTVWSWLRNDPDFPKPIMLSAGCTRWKLAEIEAWEAAKAGEAA
jgi:prophage regulatory protein